MVFGLVSLLSVPSVLDTLIGTRRSSSTYTAYSRYRSTLAHVLSWTQYEMKPGTLSWQSLSTTRSRHLQANKAGALQGRRAVSQRDLAFALISIVGFGILEPSKFSIRQRRSQDWEGYNHLFRTIGYLTGLEERYNVCRPSVEETRAVCRLIVQRVFAPCLERVPEYYEHMARALLTGLGTLDASIETTSVLYWVKHLAGVPGYVYTEADRIDFQRRLKKHLNGKADHIGVDAASLMDKSAISGLPDRPPRYLYVRDFDCLETTPAYKQLRFAGRYRLAVNNLVLAVYNTEVGRYILNLLFRWNNAVATYFPYKAFLKFGIRRSYVSMARETAKDDTKPRPNAEYARPLPPDTWYGKILTVIW
ncbi:uncharacterized protein [Epargyreus clarus]|uniref:uncharacterized protein n=1 Tax=Epargyreus clarus TaxID=520877 RepID=UPI003C2B2AF0